MSRRWKEIKEDPTRLTAYNDRARQMKNETKKSGDDSSIHEKLVAGRSAVKQPKKGPKTSGSVDTSPGTEDKQKLKKRSSNGKKLKRPHNLKKDQSLLNLLKQMTQVMKMKESLKKGQAVEKKLKIPHSVKKDQSHLNLLKQMTQVMKKKSLKKHQDQAMKKRLPQRPHSQKRDQ